MLKTALEGTVTPDQINMIGGINYQRLMEQFGTKPIDDALISQIERITKKPAHPFLTRGIFFSHRDLDILLNEIEEGKKFYLYTGIGPSSQTLHLGHLIPFMFTAYLQQAFDVPVVIQVTDDEKFLKKDLTLEEISNMAIDNIKDILACGFDGEKTFIFTNSSFIQQLYPPALSIAKLVTNNQVKGIFGIGGSDNIGQTMFPAIQAAPAFGQTFIPNILPPEYREARCLIPCGIDQDPYFRMTRDVAPRLGLPKPVLIHGKFLPSLQGIEKKASSSEPSSAIFTTDSPDIMEKKITRAFSGGRSRKEHQLMGADLSVDVPYHYLTVFLHDQAVFDSTTTNYGKGILFSGDIKALTMQVVGKVLVHHAEQKNLTDHQISQVMKIRRLA